MSDRSPQFVEEMVRVIIRFLKDRTGHGPEGYRTYLIDDMIVIRLLKALASVDYETAKTVEGRRSVKDTLGRLMEELRTRLDVFIKRSTGADVISVHFDVSTRTGEEIVVFVLDRKARELPGGS